MLLGVPENIGGIKQEVKAFIVKAQPTDDLDSKTFYKKDPKLSQKQTSRAKRFDPSEQLKSKV